MAELARIQVSDHLVPDVRAALSKLQNENPPETTVEWVSGLDVLRAWDDCALRIRSITPVDRATGDVIPPPLNIANIPWRLIPDGELGVLILREAS
jgi:hypothetical protein